MTLGFWPVMSQVKVALAHNLYMPLIRAARGVELAVYDFLIVPLSISRGCN